MEPLFIFMDLEAAHGNVYFGDIIEIAAQIDPRVLDDVIFSSIVHTKQNLSFFVLKVCKISSDMLKKGKNFPEVFNKFILWIRENVKKCCEKEKKVFYPVLVAHGGFDMDFMMIQSNMERNEMNLDILTENNIHFADTYHFLKKARLDGKIDFLQGCKLSMEFLFKRLHPIDEFIGQHRALTDVKFMIKIFLMSPLKGIFDSINIATFESRRDFFHARHTSVSETKLLSKNLPIELSKVNHTMTLRRLLRNGVTYNHLQILFKSSVSFIDFFDHLNELGIDRKSAKSIALQLTNMGLTCSGEIFEDERKEVGADDGDTLCGKENDNESLATGINRSDSGYESNPSNDNEDVKQFYNMFVDKFFYPPITYEYLFGEFSLREIENLDNCIADLFEYRFPEHPFNVIYDECNWYDESIDYSDLQNLKDERKCEPIVIPNSEEAWDDELPSNYCEEFSIPIDLGRLSKVVPIGMTMDNCNGEILSEKVPLFNHFNDIDMSSRPIGGIPKQSGKAGFREKKRRFKENKKLRREINFSVINEGSNLVKSKRTGEVFLLV